MAYSRSRQEIKGFDLMRNEKILIVDDSYDIVRLLETTLKLKGFQTVVSYDGEEALQKVKEENPDLILLDIMMPKLNGQMVLSSLKEFYPTKFIPVIMVSGVSEDEIIRGTWQSGASAYLKKPFNLLRLLELIENLLKEKKSKEVEIVEEKLAMEPVKEVFKVALLGVSDKTAKSLLQYFILDENVEIVAVLPDDNTVDLKDYMIPKHSKILKNETEILELDDADIVIETRDKKGKEKFHNELLSKNYNVIFYEGAKLLYNAISEKEHFQEIEQKLLRNLNKKVKQLSLNNEVSNLLISPILLEELLAKLVEKILSSSYLDSGAILLKDTDKDELIAFYSYGLSDHFKIGARFSIGTSFCKEVVVDEGFLTVNESEVKNYPLIKLILSDEKKKLFFGVQLKAQEKFQGLFLGFTGEPYQIEPEEVDLIKSICNQAAITIDNRKLYELSQEKQILVEKLLNKLMTAQEEERRRIAAEVHDSIAQSLVGAMAKVQTSLLLIDTDQRKVKQTLKELMSIIRENVKELRRIIYDLRPSSLDDLGLMTFLQNYLRKFQEDKYVNIVFTSNLNNDQRFSSIIEINVFRIIQEALNNVKKHACANKVDVILNIGNNNRLSLTVQDNGKGFEWNEISKTLTTTEHYGLAGMRERINLLSGHFTIESVPGQGTSIIIEIPIDKKIIAG